MDGVRSGKSHGNVGDIVRWESGVGQAVSAVYCLSPFMTFHDWWTSEAHVWFVANLRLAVLRLVTGKVDEFYTALRLVTMCICVHFRLTVSELLVCRRKSWEPSWSGSWQWSLKNVRLWRWTWNVPMIGSQRSTDKRRPLPRRSVRSVLN